jgi:hypothetical protein
MADLTEDQLRRAEARGHRTLEAEPRATAAHYNPATGRVVIELAKWTSTSRLSSPAFSELVLGSRASWLASPGEIARQGGGGPLQRGQRGAASQGGKGLTITCWSSRARRADFWRDVDQWRLG